MLNEGKKRSKGIVFFYLLSCAGFLFLSVFGLYRYKVYDMWSLIAYYIYEGILLLGMIAGGSRIYPRCCIYNDINKKNDYSFAIKPQGQIIIGVILFGALISFVYFMDLYLGIFSVASFGQSIKPEFDKMARTKAEVITQFVMHAGSAVYLIVCGSKNTVSRFTSTVAKICLFLPGLRGAFLGRRFTLAVEALIFFFVEYNCAKEKKWHLDYKKKKKVANMIVVISVISIMMIFIFSRRIVYSPDGIYVANVGDMKLKPFWEWIYNYFGDRMSVLSYISFYGGHAPYAFAYSYANVYSSFPTIWGLETFRVFIQIITSLFNLSPNYAEMTRRVVGIARYQGFAGTVINDFGLCFAPIITFIFGVAFARIEQHRYTNPICHSLYPLVQVACIFAPVYFFNVGALDHYAFWAIVLSPLCLSRNRS